jgi:glycosyltransferase involved in cell wall biosynthesis
MISIVTAYFNRKQLFKNTLDSLLKSSFADFEVIAVDDCSDDEERIDDLQEVYPFLKIIRIDKKDKWYTNPCVPFNIGFNKSKGDIIIIQNPECYHFTDILQYTNNNLTNNDYFAYSCFSLSQDLTKNIKQVDTINFFNRTAVGFDGDVGWYNHSIYRPVGLHFCSAIFKDNLDKIGGFDERYAHGIAYDDNEFLARVNRAGLNVTNNDLGIVLHQWHYSSNAYSSLNAANLIEKNKNLYFNNTLQEKIINWKHN